MRSIITSIAFAFVCFQAAFPVSAQSRDPIDIINAAPYKSDQLRSTMVSVAQRFKLVVNENEAARKNLDVTSQAAPNDKTAYKAAMRRLLDADDAIEPFEKDIIRAGELKDSGYSLAAPIDITLCNAGACTSTTPEVLFFIIIGNAIANEGNKEAPFGPSNEIVKFLGRPLGGQNSDLVKARNWAMDRLGIGGDNNDLGRALNNPAKEIKRGDVGKTVCNWVGC